MAIVTVILHGTLTPASVWATDDGKSTGPTKGNGSNGGTVSQVNLHEGVNVGVSDITVAQFRASAAGQAFLSAAGRII